MKHTWIDDNGAVRYLQEPYEIIDRPLWWHEQGLSYTASGYGARIPSASCVKLPDGRMRRIYVTIYSNIGTAWITLNGQLHVVRDVR